MVKGGQHGTEVAFRLSTQLFQVRFYGLLVESDPKIMVL